ncbi:hypothetical protein L2E82_52204 [Cichorium intybus]|nr:hypothetical protein L2E82_52204 [Cichorium intybus]
MGIYSVGVVLIIFLSCGMPCLAKDYTVGDSAGWSLNVDYTTWTTGKTFKTGDSLVFKYGSSHTVDEVNSGDYGTCTVGNSIASYTSSPATITLNTTGTHYFICGVPGHCSGGMKVSVLVTGGGASPAPSGSGASPSAKPTPTPPTATSSGSVPASSSATISPVAAVVLSLVSFVFKLVLA